MLKHGRHHVTLRQSPEEGEEDEGMGEKARWDVRTEETRRCSGKKDRTHITEIFVKVQTTT